MGLEMRKGRVLIGLALAFASMPLVAASARSPQDQPLTSLRAIHALSNAQAGHQLPVSFPATVIYYRDYERTLFVQDGDSAIYVQQRVTAHLTPGDRVLIEGTTHESFRPFISATSIQVLGHGSLPAPVPATYDRLIRANFDCRLVTVRATVRSVDLVLSSDIPSISMQMRTEAGSIDAVIDSADIAAVKNLLDAEIEITGAVSGHFDGKMQITGILLHANSLSAIKLIKPASKRSLGSAPHAMDEVLSAYHVNNTTQRVRVHGTITYYQPGSAVVLQNGSKSIWIMTQSSGPLHIGNQADAIGFPGLHDGFLTLDRRRDSGLELVNPVSPRSVTWTELATSHYLFDLVTTEGIVVAENRGAAQDEYVLDSGGVSSPPSTGTPPRRAPRPAARFEADRPRIKGSGYRYLPHGRVQSVRHPGALRHPHALDGRYRRGRRTFVVQRRQPDSHHRRPAGRRLAGRSMGLDAARETEATDRRDHRELRDHRQTRAAQRAARNKAQPHPRRHQQLSAPARADRSDHGDGRLQP